MIKAFHTSTAYRYFKNSILFSLMMYLIACGKVPTPEPDQPFGHFVGDFETGDLSGWHFLVVDTSVNTKIVTSPVRKGMYALKNTLLPDDFTNHGYRAELAVYECAKYKTEVYYGWSFMIDNNYFDQTYNLIAQWQDLPDYAQGEVWDPSPVLRGSPPPIALVYVDSTIELNMNENTSSKNETFTVCKQKINKGQWYDMVFHIYWVDDNTAYVEAWVNGLPFTPFNGTDHKYYKSNLFNRTGNYFKFGQYRGKLKATKTNIVYLDEFKVGSSYLEVAP